MLELNAPAFYAATTALASLRVRIANLKSVEDEPDGGLTVNPITDPVFLRTVSADARSLLHSLEILDARMTGFVVKRLLNSLSDYPMFEKLTALCSEIDGRLKDELTLVALFVLDQRERSFYQPSEPLFGIEVHEKFRTAVFEIEEAAKCKAMSRPTAAVFHLMRVFEVGIRATARCLQIPDPIKPAERNWGVILREIKSGLERRWPTPAGRMSPEAAKFDSVHTSLDAVRIPWRNPTMHVETIYTDDNVEHIWVVAKGFMSGLAGLCDENGDPKV